MASASVYVSGRRFLMGSQLSVAQMQPALAMEHMVRRIGLGNQVVVDAGGAQVKIRWDYQNYATPNQTAKDTTDDTWIKYRFIGNALRWKIDGAAAGDVTAADAEVAPGLVIDPAASFFALNNPPGPAGPPTLDVRLVSIVGAPPGPFTLHSAVICRASATCCARWGCRSNPAMSSGRPWQKSGSFPSTRSIPTPRPISR